MKNVDILKLAQFKEESKNLLRSGTVHVGITESELHLIVLALEHIAVEAKRLKKLKREIKKVVAEKTDLLNDVVMSHNWEAVSYCAGLRDGVGEVLFTVNGELDKDYGVLK
jgi:hypothetical protein